MWPACGASVARCAGGAGLMEPVWLGALAGPASWNQCGSTGPALGSHTGLGIAGPAKGRTGRFVWQSLRRKTRFFCAVVGLCCGAFRTFIVGI